MGSHTEPPCCCCPAPTAPRWGCWGAQKAGTLPLQPPPKTRSQDKLPVASCPPPLNFLRVYLTGRTQVRELIPDGKEGWASELLVSSWERQDSQGGISSRQRKYVQKVLADRKCDSYTLCSGLYSIWPSVMVMVPSIRKITVLKHCKGLSG